MKIGECASNVIFWTTYIPTAVVGSSLACGVGSVEGVARGVARVALSALQCLCRQTANSTASWTLAKRHFSAAYSLAFGMIPLVGVARLAPIADNESHVMKGYFSIKAVLIPTNLLLTGVESVAHWLEGSATDASLLGGGHISGSSTPSGRVSQSLDLEEGDLSALPMSGEFLNEDMLDALTSSM